MQSSNLQIIRRLTIGLARARADRTKNVLRFPLLDRILTGRSLRKRSAPKYIVQLTLRDFCNFWNIHLT